MDVKDLENRFTYHAPNPEAIRRMAAIRKLAHDLAEMINEYVPDSREQSIAITKLEESSMWANAGIARNSSERV